MAYESTVWKSGDTITSAKLNKIENALSGTSKVYFTDATVDEGNPTFNETYQQIADKFADGVVFARFYMSNVCISTQLLTYCGHLQNVGDYCLVMQGASGQGSYVASTPNDYPIPATNGDIIAPSN